VATLEKKIPKFVRKSTICARSTFERLSTSLQGGAFNRDGVVASTDGHARKVATSVVVARAGLTALESMFRGALENLSPSVHILAGFEPIRCNRDDCHA